MMSFIIRLIYLVFVFFWPSLLDAQELTIREPIRFLALGDSYTIGESVPSGENWPSQFFDSLAARGYETDTFQIIAQTGWRTDNLLDGIENESPDSNYTLVSLLIGVNDQFQAVAIDTYRENLRSLIEQAIARCNADTSSVFVLSIPDYAFTPFGQSTPDPGSISADIDSFNAVNQALADEYSLPYFNITPISREGLAIPDYVAADGLHPSGLMYSQWVSLILDALDETTAVPQTPDPQEPGLNVYPNPGSSPIRIHLENGYADTRFQLDVYNQMGGLLQSYQLRSPARRLLNLDAGLYIIVLRSKEGVLLRRRRLTVF